MTTELAGLFPVLETPFTHDEAAIDLESLEREIEFVFANDADGIVIGMLSEILRLSEAERSTLLRQTCEIADGRGPVIASVGAEATVVAARQAALAEDCGAAAVMAIPPITVPCGDDEIRRYYHSVAAATSLPIVVQDASNYVGQGLSVFAMACLQRDLADRVLFKPEAQPVGLRLGELLAATEGKARVFDGTGGVALVECFRRGVIGTMPAAEMTGAVGALWSALVHGNAARVDMLQGALAALFDIEATLDGYIVIGKYLLRKQGIIASAVARSPIEFSIDAPMEDELARLIARIEAMVGPGSVGMAPERG
jgi:dihydrodipicolinate synthase/N-acetylneuraminate lyase